MEKLLAQAQELVASLQEAKNKVVEQSNELEGRINRNTKINSELEDRKADLDARETAVEASEKPAVMLEEAKKIQSLNKESLQAVDTAQKGFAKERADFNAKVAKDTAELEAKQSVHQKEMEVLKADRKKLEEDKENYKDEILNKLKVSVK